MGILTEFDPCTATCERRIYEHSLCEHPTPKHEAPEVHYAAKIDGSQRLNLRYS
jgi:hypothetical protein